jgi:hypothetical protein
MKNPILSSLRVRRVMATTALAIAATFIFLQSASAVAWNGIEPLKSRRTDVERLLGKPVTDKPGNNGMLQFNVAGGVVTIAFIDARFVASKKLQPELEGTVRQVVLQHTNSNDTPESLNIASNSNFERQDGSGGIVIYRNLKDGIAYTFMNGKLKHTYFTPSQEEWARAQK